MRNKILATTSLLLSVIAALADAAKNTKHKNAATQALKLGKLMSIKNKNNNAAVPVPN